MLRIPIENWSDEELEAALSKYSRKNPSTENPTQTIRDIVKEFEKRKLNAVKRLIH